MPKIMYVATGCGRTDESLKSSEIVFLDSRSIVGENDEHTKVDVSILSSY